MAPRLLRLLPLALLVEGVCACHGDGARRLQGSWHGVRAEGVAASNLAAANAFAANMSFEIKGDGIVVTTAKDRQEGHYRVVKDDKSTVVITTDKDGPGDPQTFTFLDDKTLKWAVLEGQQIVFTRP